jgi:hypothetical protein
MTVVITLYCGNKNEKLFKNILKVEENIENFDKHIKETESMDNRDKEEIGLAIKDIGDVMESLI